MRTRINKRSDNEIIADIIKLVGCPPEAAPFVDRIVGRLINDLRAAPQPFSGNQTDNVAFAERLRSQIVKLENALKNAPNSFLLSVLFEERFSQLWAAASGTIEINANTKGYIVQERSHQKHFTKLLGRLRAQCDGIISRKPGGHAGIKHEHRHAAWASFAVLEFAASYTGKELHLTCSGTSKFVRVAGLFLEAATGEDNADLRRACEAIKLHAKN